MLDTVHADIINAPLHCEKYRENAQADAIVVMMKYRKSE
jgi:hypothetical protein